MDFFGAILDPLSENKIKLAEKKQDSYRICIFLFSLFLNNMITADDFTRLRDRSLGIFSDVIEYVIQRPENALRGCSRPQDRNQKWFSFKG